MILHAGNGLVLTQSADLPIKERAFRSHVTLVNASDAMEWKEITEKQKEQMLAETAIIDVDDMNVDSIRRMDEIIGKVTAKINEVPMTTEESLELLAYFPQWKQGEFMPIGYKVSYDGVLYEVVQEHTSQADWTPNVAVSLFKVVKVEMTNTINDPILWEQGMVLEEGEYYMDGAVKYKCIRNSGNPLWYPLEALVGNYVEVVV